VKCFCRFKERGIRRLTLASENEIRKPENCVNCGSVQILGPYGGFNTRLKLGGFHTINLKVFVCVECGYTMLMTTQKSHQNLIDREERKHRKKAKSKDDDSAYFLP